ncbi:MAG: hypothetical protein ABW133_14215 [Polyangiaceae bacterium]
MKTTLRMAMSWALVVVATGCGADKAEEGGGPILPPPDANADARDVGNLPPDVNGDTRDTGPGSDATDASDAILADAIDATDGRDADASDAILDAPVCPAMTVLAYKTPGCGVNTPPPYCQGPTDACLTYVCDCNGVTTGSGCGFSTVPFASWGSCPDAAPPDAADVLDASDAGDSADVQRDGDAGDALTDVLTDALMCPQGTVVAYNQPGCGINTPPAYCQGPTDACLGPVCDCNGVTNWSGCGFAQVPFAAWGVCPDGGGIDASGD